MSQNWLGKITGSIGGVLIGILLVLIATYALFINEGRTDYSAIAQNATEIDQLQDQDNPEELVYTTGELITDSKLKDPYLKEQDFIALNRVVEMYAWKENRDTNSNDETVYSYSKVWTSSPADSTKFKEPSNHFNPPASVQPQNLLANSANLNQYQVELSKLDLPRFQDLQMDQEILDENLAQSEDLTTFENKYLFVGEGEPGSPEVGDLRISYRFIPNNQKVTVFGTKEQNSITPYFVNKTEKFYRAFDGSKQEAIAVLANEYSSTILLWRVGGFILYWIGLSLILGPITTIIGFVPILGSLTKFTVGILTFVLSLILTVSIILISIIAHNILFILAFVAIVVAGVYLYFYHFKKEQEHKSKS